MNRPPGIQPTGWAAALFAAAIPVALFIVAADARLWRFALDPAALVLVATMLDAALVFPRRRLSVTVNTPDLILIGERGEMIVELGAARSSRPLRFELLPEWRGPVEPPTGAFLELEPGSPARLALPLSPRRRGRLTIERLWMRWRGPLGLIRRVAVLPVGKVVDIAPNTRAAQQAALAFAGREFETGQHPLRLRGDGSEFNALGEYVAGHDPRHIDWKHSARHRRLLVKEYQDESNQPVVLAFDTGHLMAEPVAGMPRLDHAITAGLALAWLALRGGDLAGLYGFDAVPRSYLPPLRGGTNFARFQHEAAGLDYHPEETNYTLGLAELSARLSRRSLVVLFTDFVDTVTAELLVESLERVASRHAVIFVTPRDDILKQTAEAPPDRFADIARAVMAHDFLRERRVVLERLQRLGIHVIDGGGRDLPAALLDRYLTVKRRGMI